MSEPPVRILLVEDNPGDAFLLRKTLRDAGSLAFELEHAEDLESALELLQRGSFDVVLLDLSLPDSEGLETFERVYTQAPGVPVLALTGMADEALAMRTVHAGAQDYLMKSDLNGRSLVRDIRYAIERKHFEEHLRQLTALQSAILDSAEYSIISTDVDGRIRTFNAAAERLLGYHPDEVIGRESPLLIHVPEEVTQRADELTAELGTPVAPDFQVFTARARLSLPDEHEWTYVRKDGSRFPVSLSLTALRDHQGQVVGFLGIGCDITERKRAEAEVARLLVSEREKSEQLELSVREAHHRIKNNLQAISDLLYLEQASGEERSMKASLHESMERIHAIALVHDLLSLHDDVQTVDIRAVFERLVPMILKSRGLSQERVVLTMEVPTVRVSSKRATTLALIMNELVSNAAKHAFTSSKVGLLSIRLRQAAEELVLVIQDNGPGLSPGFNLSTDAHVGLEVVQIMAERDLGGRFNLENVDGLRAEVRFHW